MNEVLNPAIVPDYVAKAARVGKCDGSCEQHVGEVAPVWVDGWGWFSYCEAAIADDKDRGLTVTVRRTA